MGHRRSETMTETLSFKAEEKLMNQIDRIAERTERNRSFVLRKLVLEALEVRRGPRRPRRKTPSR